MTTIRRPNRGKSLENFVDLCARAWGYNVPLPPSGQRHLGAGKIIGQRMPFDKVIVLRPTGTLLAMDCKVCDVATSFPVGNRDHVKAHQIEHLRGAGEAGALSGLLVHATHARAAGYYWLPWRFLLSDRAIPWKPMWRVGDVGRTIDIGRLIVLDRRWEELRIEPESAGGVGIRIEPARGARGAQ